MKQSLLSLGLGLLLLPTLQASELETLWQDLQYRHPGLNAAESAIKAREAEAASERWRYGPTLTLKGRYTRLDDELGVEVDVSSLAPGAPPMYEKVQDVQYANAYLEARLPVYTGGRIGAAVDAADARLADESARAGQNRQQVLLQLVDRYYNVVMARETVAIRERNLQTLDKQVYSARRREEEGLIAPSERLSAEVERDKARRAMSTSQADLDLAVLVFRQWVGEAHPLPDPGPLTPLSIEPDMNRLTRHMLENAPEMAQLNARTDLARAGLEARTAGWKPTVALFGRYELLPDSLTALEPRWAAGVAFEWSLLGEGNRLQQRRAALARVEQAARQTEQSETDLISRLQHDYRDLQRANADIESLASSEDLIQERVTLTRRGYEQGLNTTLDWVEAETALAGIRLQRLNAVVDQHRALARLYIHAGDEDRFFTILDQPTAEKGQSR
ncbi:TolC family protein [Saccharospirillum salsuginis]|uniref:Transporter n=1 Tax=Saccharospirillum salsuginis TaxID=418750 RepID=A0A918KAA3_9GAMM|nr:TolC family protein [Saccharospirillum salsuginis]GGX53937.1 transporter [Saccharospirillum salsuginis]